MDIIEQAQAVRIVCSFDVVNMWLGAVWSPI